MLSGSTTRGWRARLLRLLGIAVGTYVAVCLAVAGFQRKLIYFPTREHAAKPSAFGLDHDEVTLQTSDGVHLAAWFFPRLEARGTILFFHGNGGNMADRLRSVTLLQRLGCNVLIFDYRGYGRSDGSPSEAGLYRDAEAAWDYLVQARGEPPPRIVLFGRSLGGAVAIELAHRVKPAALIVESTFTSLADVAKHHYPLLPVRWILRDRYASIEKIGDVSCRKLFFHGKDDEVVPLALGRELFDAAAAPKEFVITLGGHNDSGFESSREDTARLKTFVEAVLSSPGP